jgi:pilus assembly protein CpaF
MPMCDARLHDGSRVNIILPPLSLGGATLTIRKFKRDKLTLDKLLEFGSIDQLGADLIRLIAGCRVNTIVSGGTGSGKTTMLNCLTRYIHPRERIVTCEDSAELQLQQPHVVRLETRMANLEGVGEVMMRDLVRNCLRMRPERIIVGEVRGPEAFDLLQAMNTGHDGSMGTVHANTPRDALDRIESMIAMNRLNIPPETIRRQIASSINVVIQVQRLRDGTRKVMSISELTGLEGDTISMQDLLTYEIDGEDENGMVTGHFVATGLRPRFYPKLKEFGMQHLYDAIIEQYLTKK